MNEFVDIHRRRFEKINLVCIYIGKYYYIVKHVKISTIAVPCNFELINRVCVCVFPMPFFLHIEHFVLNVCLTVLACKHMST